MDFERIGAYTVFSFLFVMSNFGNTSDRSTWMVYP